MKERYILLMEKTLSAYTHDQIQISLDDVKNNGLKEHGFTRLTANIGILIAHGRQKSLLPLFMEMMEVCCDMFLRPYVKAANEFSIREIVCCIDELDKSNTVDKKHIFRWKQKISEINPEACYDVVVKNEHDNVNNWAIFGAVSEYARFHFGLGKNLEFVDRQLSCQLQCIDENGMYQDNRKESIHQPIMYDYVARGLFAMLLHWGYRGKYFKQIDDCLRQAGLLTLKMQSAAGEAPFGGRSNQFLHNEAWAILLFEYEANRYAKEGNIELAKAFKSAIVHALSLVEEWLSKTPIRHIKNRFPADTKYGCEYYAYFDKYMITLASNLYAAYLLCNDSILPAFSYNNESVAFQTSYHFHKLFLKSAGYSLEFDTNADSHYDATGLGKIHKQGAPTTICLSCPCPASPAYTVDIEKTFAFSMCCAIRKKNGWIFAAEESSKYEVLNCATEFDSVSATIMCNFSENEVIKEHYTINEGGITVTLKGNGDIGYGLPAFCFDGKVSPHITFDRNELAISYEGWICKYTTTGIISDMNRIVANRNGHYRVFLVSAQNTLEVKIEIIRQ